MVFENENIMPSRHPLITANSVLKHVIAAGLLLAGSSFCADAVGDENPTIKESNAAVALNQTPWHASLTQDGLLLLRLSSIPPDYSGIQPAAATAVVLTRGTTITNTTRSGPNGIAQVGRVREGTHSLITVSPNGIAASGLYVSNKMEANNSPIGNVAELALVPLSEVGLVREIFARRARASSLPPGQVLSADEVPNLGPLGIPQYVIRPDGSFLGRLVRTERLAVRASSDLRVTFIRNGQVLAESKTDRLGLFQVPAGQVSPGPVSVVAAGADGYAIFGAEVIAAPLTSSDGHLPDGTYPVFFQGDGAGVAATSVSSPESAPLMEEALSEPFEDMPPPPADGVAGVGLGGGGAGSGGGGGGGGGGGAALGAVGLGLGAAALGVALDNDKDHPASPSQSNP